MSQYTANDIHMLNANYLLQYATTDTQLHFIINYLRHHGLLTEFLHYIATGELPSQTTFEETSEDYLQDNYNF